MKRIKKFIQENKKDLAFILYASAVTGVAVWIGISAAEKGLAIVDAILLTDEKTNLTFLHVIHANGLVEDFLWNTNPNNL